MKHLNLLPQHSAPNRLLRVLAWAVVAEVLVLLAWGGFGGWQVHRQGGALASSQAQLVQVQGALAKQRQQAGLVDSQALTQQLTALQKQMDVQRDWVDWLRKGELGSPQGYSFVLKQLAGVHVEGVWLQTVEVKNNGQSVVVMGKSLSADAVMDYMAQTNEDFKPQGISFSSFDMKQAAPAASAVAARGPEVLDFRMY